MIPLNEGSDEFQKIKEEWKGEARKCTLETLPVFLQKITTEYQHDYGTICPAETIRTDQREEPRVSTLGFNR